MNVIEINEVKMDSEQPYKNNFNYDTASYARAYQTRAGFRTPIFILVTKALNLSYQLFQTDGQLIV